MGSKSRRDTWLLSLTLCNKGTRPHPCGISPHLVLSRCEYEQEDIVVVKPPSQAEQSYENYSQKASSKLKPLYESLVRAEEKFQSNKVIKDCFLYWVSCSCLCCNRAVCPAAQLLLLHVLVVAA